MLTHLLVQHVALAATGIVGRALRRTFLTWLAITHVWLTRDFVGAISAHRRVLHTHAMNPTHVPCNHDD